MHMIAGVLQYVASPPSRRRGLKIYDRAKLHQNDVASFAEAWIENEVDKLPHYVASRLLRGGVD